MKKLVQLSISPELASNEVALKKELRESLGLNTNDSIQFKPIKRSIDARNRNIKINLTIEVAINEEFTFNQIKFNYQNVQNSKVVHIIGAGPAGLFAALRCLELGLKPVVFERGKNVKDRRRDLAILTKQQIVNPDSNYCFGEGGAGTYSDGKLYTRSGKKEEIQKVLECFVFHGAGEEILIDAHPHIGTNKLPGIIERIRNTILNYGGEIHFDSKLTGIQIRDNRIETIVVIKDFQENEYPVNRLILATGHSARDIYELLYAKQVLLEAKPFAMGVRAEHPQAEIDKIQYHCKSQAELNEKRKYLPAAAYSLVSQVEGRGVYSFCMCPGGIIAPCATAQEEVVTNGWSPSKRNNPFANSGIVMGIDERDWIQFKNHGPLAGLRLQQVWERKAWELGGKTQKAPAQRLEDFLANKQSNTLPLCSYHPGLASVEMEDVIGAKYASILRQGFKEFIKKMPKYLHPDAVIVGVESRTSTPVRIPRDKITGRHPQIEGLYPCGEGAGFAGGIVSAALDGIRTTNAVKETV